MRDDAVLPPDAFDKVDVGHDLAFYAPPRLVTHIDDAAVAALTGFYREVLQAGHRVLDLMSSWVSHLPADRRYAEVVGHGMNADELAANPRLDRWNGPARTGGLAASDPVGTNRLRGVR